MKKTGKWYSKMSPAELEKMTARFDQEIDLSETRPLTAAMKRQEQQSKRKKPGRPRTGLGAMKLRISMEKGLLKRVDAYAESHGLTRSDLIAKSLQKMLTSA